MADARTETSPERGPSPALVPRLAMIGITKRFPGVLANSDIDLMIRAGEIHVLLGENGAGKSTLVALLSGLLQPDAGRIEIDGQVRRLDSPARALALGIGTVFQHGMLAPSLTVAETIALGGPWWRPSNRAAMARKIQVMNADLGLAIDPGAVTGGLSLGEQQQVEIMRALLRGSHVLILDESTSMLTPRGAEDLGALMRRLAERGIAVLFITHKLHEAFAYANRISVLRLGRKVGEIGPERLAALDETALSADVVRMMFGTGTADAGRGDAPSRRRSTAGAAPDARGGARGPSRCSRSPI